MEAFWVLARRNWTCMTFFTGMKRVVLLVFPFPLSIVRGGLGRDVM